MAATGRVGMWAPLFAEELIPDIIELVLDGWASFSQPSGDELEVPITRRLREHLRKEKNLRRLPFSIWPESSETDPETGAEIGRIDLRFLHGWREGVYFAIECKRLNVVTESGRRKSLAGPYLREGMMRFLDGKYASGLDKGGMLGYVMDGKVAHAIRSVAKAINKRRVTLLMAKGTGLDRSSVKPDNPLVKETRHSLASGEFVIHHLYVPAQ